MYVYFIVGFREKALQHVKIGWSKDPDARLRDLQIGSPVQLRMMGKVRCKSNLHAQQIEKMAHRLFHKQRRRGEWFKLGNKHMEQLRSLVERAAERQQQDALEAEVDMSDDNARLNAEFRAVVGAAS